MIVYSESWERDPQTDIIVDVQIRVDVPDGRILPQEILDDVAEDAVESVLVQFPDS